MSLTTETAVTAIAQVQAAYNCSDLDAITRMQGAAASDGDERSLEVLCAIKGKLIEVANQHPIKITAPGIRFGVRMTGQDGVFMKDMNSQHWTTYPVRDMTRKEADEVVAYELAKGSCNTYEIIDLDEADQVRKIRSAAAKAVRDLAGYDAIPYAIRKEAEGIGADIRRVALLAADRAEALARA